MSDRLERLLNLVIALRETRVPMPAAEIRERVAGYGHSDQAAFRRMFERDKADLRDLGVPIAVDPEEGYRIPPEDYDLPPVALAPDELTALAVAVQAAGLDDGRALRKLEVDTAGEAGVVPTEELPVAVALEAPHRDALLTAQLSRRRVRFAYRPPSRQPAQRTVDPAGLVYRSGRWYLVGHDLDRDARRAFRLDRITSEVEDVGEAATPASTVDVDDVVPDTDGGVVAEVAASPEVAWLVARRARGGGRFFDNEWSAYTLSARDAGEMLGWLLRLGPDVEVLAPADLRASAVAALDALGHAAAQAREAPPRGEEEGTGAVPPTSNDASARPGAQDPRGSAPPSVAPRPARQASNPTLERLERILAMVPWLLANPGAPITEVAERFDATPARVAADLDLLGYCGVPGYGGGDLVMTRVVGDRVTVEMADFFKRPLRLGVREAITLLLAGRSLVAAPGWPGSEPLRRAVARLEDVLGAAAIAVDLGVADGDLLARLRDAVTRRRVVHLRYRAAASERDTEREVEPWALVGAGGSWYLHGHCRVAGGPRHFRLDRIREATVTDATAPEPPAQSPARPRYEPAPGDLEVVLDLDPTADWLLDAVPYASAEGQRVRLRARSVEWAARLVLSLAGAARPVHPPALVDRVAELADAARARYARDRH